MIVVKVETRVDLVHVAGVSEVTIPANGRRITIRKDLNTPPPKHAPVEVVLVPAVEHQQAEAQSPAPTPVAEPIVAAQMVGVFHSAEPPLGVGANVEPGQVVGVIESMRLMNDVCAEVGGIIEAILVEDGMAVEYGQPIFGISAPSPANGGETGA